MEKKYPAKQATWIERLMPSFVLRAFGQLEQNPEAPDHGASWTVGNGVAPTFSPRQSMAVYARHAYTNACVTRASQDIASLPIKLLKGKGAATQEITDHPVLELFEQPSATVDGYLFREQFIVDLMLTGNCYTLIVGAETAPTSLYRLHPENVRIIPDPVKMIKAFEYSDGGSQVQYPPERVVHVRNASWDVEARGELYGSGIVEALNEEITADINAQRMSASVSKQGRPDVLLSPSDPADIWDRKRRQEITQAYKAMTDHGGAMALSGQIQVETLNLSPRDIEFQALRTLVRENISAVCGVPSTVLGLPDANYATARQATITYWEIQQKRARKLEQFMTRVAKLFDTQLRVEIDFDSVDALQAIRSEQLDRVVLHIQNGMSAAAAYSYEGLSDSPFGVPEEEPSTQQEQAIENALLELVERAEQSQKKKKEAEEAFHNLEYEIRGSVGDKDPTNFPEDGEDKQVALRNSQYDRFPHEEAERLKQDYPQIWDKGGNILGNLQYRRLKPIAERESSIAQTETEELAIRKREAWAARHFRDHRLAGVVAQIKWLVVGSRGLDHMRAVISEAKAKLDKQLSQEASEPEQSDEQYWQKWLERSQVPAERQVQRATEIYLEQAIERYVGYAKKLHDAQVQQQKSISYSTILGRMFEVAEVKRIIGRAYRTVFTLTGNDQLAGLFDMIGRTRPLELLFNERKLADSHINQLAKQLVNTNEKMVRKTVTDGIQEGLSQRDIANLLRQKHTFSKSRAQIIAQTESTRAINTATAEAYTQFSDETGLKVYKRWVSSFDDRTRDSHIALDNKTKNDPIPAAEPFEIGSATAMAPAGFGVASLDINCRCTIAPVVIRD